MVDLAHSQRIGAAAARAGKGGAVVTVVLPAYRVATPVLERLPPAGIIGTVLGASATAAWVDLGGFVVAITTREVPLLPNAVGLTAGAGALERVGRPGGAVRCAAGRVDLGGLRVVWDPADPPAWDPTVRVAVGSGRPGPHPSSGNYSRSGGAPAGPFGGATVVGRRGEGVLAALGVPLLREPGGIVAGLAEVGLETAREPDGAAGIELLLRAVLERDSELAAGAAGVLVGRGPGLTPEGDDLLAAVAATLATLGPAAGVPGACLAGLLAALVPERTTREGPGPGGAGAPAGRTTALAATLLELAARGQVVEPAGWLLDLSPAGERAWPGALRRLERLGHGSGRAYAVGIGAAAWLLAAGDRVG
jgi:Protein of unknown function (DUF2877)